MPIHKDRNSQSDRERRWYRAREILRDVIDILYEETGDAEYLQP